MSASVASPDAAPRVVRGLASARINLDGRDYINFAGGGYLALGQLPELRQAARRVVEAGCAFARQLPSAYGISDPFITDLENAAASYCGTETAVYCASGYLIGATALNSLDLNQCRLFIDERAHFSLVEAGRAAATPPVSFGHCDADALSAAIHRTLPPRMRPVVLTDGVFGTTGRLAPLDQYASVLATYDGRLIVDEAHGFGVIGPHGRGAADFLGVDSTTLIAATLSKAFCAQGGIIASTAATIAKLRTLPPLRGANSGSPISAAVSAVALRHMMAHPERRARLAELTRYLREKLRARGIDITESPAPIVAFQVGDEQAMRSLQQRLFQRGIHIMISNYIGAGPQGVIRCAVFADHSEADLDALVERIN